MNVLGIVVLKDGTLLTVVDTPAFVASQSNATEKERVIERVRGLCVSPVTTEIIPSFMKANKGKKIVTNNAKKLYHTMKGTNDAECTSCFVNAVDAGRVRDVRVLHSLIGLAVAGSKIQCGGSSGGGHTKVNELAETYCHFSGIGAEKEEACRVLPQLYEQMSFVATKLMDAYRDEYLDDVIQKFGYLSDVIQVKSIVALAEVEDSGIRVDRGLLEVLTERSQKEASTAAEQIAGMPEFSDCCNHRCKDTGDGTLTIDKTKCKAHLKAMLELDKTKKVKKPIKLNTLCKCRRAQSPFIAAYLDYCTAEARLNFLSSVRSNLSESKEEDIVHPRYDYLTRNGRTRAREPNIQTAPADAEYRAMFVPRKGCVFATLDYDFIELCTLAAVCETRYGPSVLVRVIRDGIDPHCFTAAMLLGMELPEFMALRESAADADRARFQEWRQKAKAVNFGIPSGWNSAALRDHVEASFGTKMTLEEAEAFRDLLVRDIYPEIGLYLYENSIELLAQNLKCSYSDVWFNLWNRKRSLGVIIAIRNTIRGHITKKAGGKYSRDLIQLVWEGVLKLSARPEVDPSIHKLAEQIMALDKFDGAPLSPKLEALHSEIYDRLFTSDCATLTGRVRARASFTKARNTPFSGLAADGAKLALFDMIFHGGYRVVGFVHDEFIVEVPAEKVTDITAKEAEVERLKNIAIDAMTTVTGGVVKITCKCKVASAWTK